MKKILAAFVGIVVLATAGFSFWHFLGTSSPVATIGNDKVTVADVNNSVNEILAERKGVSTTGMQLATGADLTLAEVNFHVIAYLLADTASENLVNVTQAQIASRRANIVTQVGGEAKLSKALVAANIAQKDFPLYLHTLLFEEGLSALVIKEGVNQANATPAVQALIVAEAKKVGIVVNPKFGKWDETQVGVVRSTSSVLTSPVPAPAPSVTQ